MVKHYIQTALFGIIVGSIVLVLPKFMQKDEENLASEQNPQKLPSKNLQKKLLKFLPKFKWNHQEEAFSEKEQVFIKNKQTLSQKLATMKTQGLKNFQVVTDFDQTISPFEYQGKHSHSALGCFRKSPYVPESMADKMTENFNKYYPYEQSTEITKEQKRKYMQEWNDNVEEIFKTSNLNSEIVQKTVDSSNFATRFGFKQFFQNCHRLNMPFYVVSGGINIIIHTVLGSILDIDSYENLYLHANEMKFDKHGKVIDFDMKINTGSKFEVLNTDRYQFQKNTILFGDSDTDILMGQKMNSENLVSILFVKESQAKNIDKLFESGWDIIIRCEQGQGGFLVPEQLFNFINDDEFEIVKSLDNEKKFQTQENYKELREVLEKSNN